MINSSILYLFHLIPYHLPISLKPNKVNRNTAKGTRCFICITILFFYLRDKQFHHKYLSAAPPYTQYVNSHLKKAPSGFDPKYPHPLLSLPHINHITHSSLSSKISHLLITACFSHPQIANRFLHFYQSLQTPAAPQGYRPALYGSLSA